MIFSADYYPGTPLINWKLPGAEIIIDKKLRDTYEQMVAHGIYLSAHSPMSVAIGSVKKGVRYLSTETICENLELLKALQPSEHNHIVVHAANFSNRTAEEVYEVQRKTLWSLWYKMKERGLLDNSLICIENLGKLNQVGDVADIVKLCKLTDNFIPCIDFGHLHGRTLGKYINSKEDILEVIQYLYGELPAWKVDCMHIHFSKLLYTDKGEKKHTPFSDKEAGPKPAHFIRALDSLPLTFNPIIICESPDSYKDGYKLYRNFEAHRRSVLK